MSYKVGIIISIVIRRGRLTLLFVYATRINRTNTIPYSNKKNARIREEVRCMYESERESISVECGVQEQHYNSEKGAAALRKKVGKKSKPALRVVMTFLKQVNRRLPVNSPLPRITLPLFVLYTFSRNVKLI